MFLLVLRLLAVYFGTAAAALWLAHRFVSALKLRVAFLLAFGPFLLAGKALVTAGVYGPIDIAYGGYPMESKRGEMGIWETRTPLLSDVVHSYIPSRKAVREAVKNGRLPLWNRFSMAGEPLLAFQQPAALHPATWIGFSLPLAQAWTFEMAFRLLLALLCGYLFFREIGCREPESLLGALGWAFCDHLVFFLGYSVSAALAPFPLLLVGLERCVRGPARSAVGVTTVALVLIILAGHPESVLHAVVGGGIFFLFESYGVQARHWPRAIWRAVLAGALSLGLTAIVLIPFAEIVPHTWAHAVRSVSYASATKSVSLTESFDLSIRNFLPFVYGVSGHGEIAHGSGLPAGYAGSLLVPLAALGLASRRREKWAFLILLLLGLALWARLSGVADLAGRLPLLRISVNDYFVYLAAFGTVGLGVLGAEQLRDPRWRRVLPVLALIYAGVLLFGFSRFHSALIGLRMSPSYLRYRLLIQLLPLILLAAWLWLKWSRSDARLALAGLVVILAVQRGLEAGEVYPTLPSRAFYPALDLLAGIPRNTPDRVVSVGFTFVPDSSALYELEDARGYEALVLTRLVETYPLWCIDQPVWFNRVDDPTRPFLSFLNVRYAITGPFYPPPPGWKVLAQSTAGKVLENPAVVPRVFVPDNVGYVRDGSRQIELLAQIVNFRTHGIVERGEEPLVDSSAWTPNGRATLRITLYTSDDIRLEIEAQESAVIATSIPAWPGWRASVDGMEVPTAPYNRAFLSFRVPTGRHAARLRYLPRGFLTGLAVSTATMGLAVALAGAAWRRDARRRQEAGNRLEGETEQA